MALIFSRLSTVSPDQCDLDKHLQEVTDEEVAEKRKEIEEFFVISEDDAADPLAQKPTEEQ